MTWNAREAAYRALLASLQGKRFIADVLEEWKETAHPSTRDFHLAKTIAYGACQMALTLDFMALHLCDKKKLSLKLKEKAILRISLYQAAFVSRIPLYAITNEMMAIAKQNCHHPFVRFLNAICRKLEGGIPLLPKDNLSIRFSYPEFFINQLIDEYGVPIAKKIMEAGNVPSIPMVRHRFHSLKAITEFDDFQKYTTDPAYYIQNITPATLIEHLAETCRTPSRILDLCASPGGKLLAVHDLYPDATLYANDVSEEKLDILRENCQKYGLKVTLSCVRGEEYTSDTYFDLIILDVPCSNTGVLNKRPEARWRLTEDNLLQLEDLTRKLFRKAISLLTENGEIWFMTCSILSRENQKMVAWACEELGLIVKEEKLVLPNLEGRDGGYAARCIRQNFDPSN